MKTMVRWLGVGFGTGYSPVAPGTVGTLLGLALVAGYGAATSSDMFFVTPSSLAFCVILSLLAVPICGRTEQQFGKKDDGRIVADEYLTFPICMLGMPLQPTWFLVAFLSNRFFDIVKIPPAYQAQRLKGGWGIVVDDVIAALFSLAFNHGLLWVVGGWHPS